MKVRTLGIDLAKNVFLVHGVDSQGKTVVRRELRRRQVVPFMRQLQPCLVGMEACGGAHYWAREIAKLGHEVRLMSPQFVRPYVKTNKNDARDAEAICEAVGRPSMRFVAIKSQAQQDMMALHRSAVTVDPRAYRVDERDARASGRMRSRSSTRTECVAPAGRIRTDGS
jgi:transposase